MNDLRSPVSRARGLGTAKSGTDHYIFQRLTAIALVPLLLWFMVSLISVSSADYMAARTWVSSPGVTILMVLMLVALFYHAQLGLQVVLEDYIHREATKIVSLIAMKFAMFALGTAAVVSVLRIALGG